MAMALTNKAKVKHNPTKVYTYIHYKTTMMRTTSLHFNLQVSVDDAISLAVCHTLKYLLNAVARWKYSVHIWWPSK